MTENAGSANGAHGGVGHLLRMAKTQCGVTMAFAALRKPDGGFAIATFPSLSADPSWTVEAIDELVSQTWEDPNLSSGSILVRSGRVLRGMWTGQGHHVKLATAALSDPGTPERPWGLLCVAEPVAGHFEQEQLIVLAALALRLTSYLRARQEVLEGALGFEDAGIDHETPADPSVRGVPEATATVAAHLIDDQPPSAPPISDVLRDVELEDETSWVEETIGTEPPESVTELPSRWEDLTPPVDAGDERWEPLDLSDDETGAPVSPPAEAGEDQASASSASFEPDPEQAAQPPRAAHAAFGTREAPVPVAEFFTSETPGDLALLLAPDRVTGLAGLPTLMSRLSSSLTHVTNYEGSVGVILIDVSPVDDTVDEEIALMVAGRLTNRVRERDLVARIGPSLFAVMVDLRPGAVDLETIRQRTVSSLTAGSSSNALQIRSAAAVAGEGSPVVAEGLLRQAAEHLASE
jgi:hypothetical protein